MGLIHARASQTARGLETKQYAMVGSLVIRNILRSRCLLLDNT